MNGLFSYAEFRKRDFFYIKIMFVNTDFKSFIFLKCEIPYIKGSEFVPVPIRLKGYHISAVVVEFETLPRANTPYHHLLLFWFFFFFFLAGKPRIFHGVPWKVPHSLCSGLACWLV